MLKQPDCDDRVQIDNLRCIEVFLMPHVPGIRRLLYHFSAKHGWIVQTLEGGIRQATDMGRYKTVRMLERMKEEER